MTVNISVCIGSNSDDNDDDNYNDDNYDVDDSDEGEHFRLHRLQL